MNTKNTLNSINPGDFANYKALGQLDGIDADIFASNVCNDRIVVHSGLLSIGLSTSACIELVKHLSAAIEAQQKAASQPGVES